MILSWSNLNDLNFSSILTLSMKVWSSFINSEKGRQKEFFIEPLLRPFLGSATLPSNLSLLLARSRERFEGKVAEPRKGLRSGSIKNSFCLPFSELIKEDHTFIDKVKILEKFKSFKFDHDKIIVFSCGSGVTASVLALAYSLINAKYMPTIYDGSWAEYGKINL